jgi:glycosyltransferase involved in cell wall biosynthesis
MDFVMDIDLIAEVARRRPDWQWVLIGRKSNLVKISGPNIHFLGPKPYSELPHYVRHFDVCVLPWSLGNAFTRYGSAIKVREYLATGKPVLIAPLYEYVNVPGIRTYGNAQEFISAVDQALNHDTVEDRQLRQMAVRDCTWDRRAFEVGELISSLLAQSACRESLSTPLSQSEI